MKYCTLCETVQSSDDDGMTQRRVAGFGVRLEECSKSRSSKTTVIGALMMMITDNWLCVFVGLLFGTDDGFSCCYQPCGWFQNSAVVPRWQVPPVSGPWGSRSSPLSVIIVTDRPSCPGCQLSVNDWAFPFAALPPPPTSHLCLEWTTVSRHVCTVPVNSVQSSEDLFFQPFLSRLSVAPAKRLSAVIRPL